MVDNSINKPNMKKGKNTKIFNLNDFYHFIDSKSSQNFDIML
jgi:hypothetical protein